MEKIEYKDLSNPLKLAIWGGFLTISALVINIILIFIGFFVYLF